MKTYKHLYKHICSFENLYLAYKAAARGKRGRADVASFEMELEDNLLELQEQLVTQSYTPDSYRHFTIHEPKRRRISAAPFRDRVVHHALVRVIEPIMERRFIHGSYACRRDKGTHRALNQCSGFTLRYRYVLKCDIEKFFASIDHVLLREVLAKNISDKQALWLIDSILRSGEGILAGDYRMTWFPGDDLLAVLRPRGLPIGNLTSQFWANVYLNPLDQFVKRELKCGPYLRYCDDFLLFHNSKRMLWKWKHAIMTFLAYFRLNLHTRQSTVFPVTSGIPFLGWSVFPTHRRLKRRNGVAFARRFHRLAAGYAAGVLEAEEIRASVRGWVAHACHGSTYGLRRAILSRCYLPGRHS